MCILLTQKKQIHSGAHSLEWIGVALPIWILTFGVLHERQTEDPKWKQKKGTREPTIFLKSETKKGQSQNKQGAKQKRKLSFPILTIRDTLSMWKKPSQRI